MTTTPTDRLRRKKRSNRLDVTNRELVILQDSLDDWAGDAASAQTGAAAARTRALQRKLHTLTGEEMPPTQAEQRAHLGQRLKRDEVRLVQAFRGLPGEHQTALLTTAASMAESAEPYHSTCDEPSRK